MQKHVDLREKNRAEFVKKKRQELKLRKKEERLKKLEESNNQASGEKFKRKKSKPSQKRKKAIGQMFLTTERTKVVQANKDNIEFYNKWYEDRKSDSAKKA